MIGHSRECFSAGISLIFFCLTGCVAVRENAPSTNAKISPPTNQYRGITGNGTAAGVAARPELSLKIDSPRDIGAVLDDMVAKHGVPGLAAVVLQGDRIVALGAGGVRKSGASERITVSDQFLICSGTKAMTATLAAMAVERGELSWATTVGEMLSARGTRIDPGWEPVTLAQLLEHRAGAPDDTQYLWKILRLHLLSNATPSEKRRELIYDVLSRPPVYLPGSRFLYTSLDYFMVSAMLERVTGRPWEDLIQDWLWRPLGIATGGFGTPGTPGTIDQPWGHWGGFDFASYKPGEPVPPGSFWGRLGGEPFYAPAGTARMTIADWAKFIELHLRGDPGNPHRHEVLLGPDSFAVLHAFNSPSSRLSGLKTENSGPISRMPGGQGQLGYESGWFLENRAWANGRRMGDSGRVLRSLGDSGWVHVDAVVAPEIDFAVLLICNQGGVDNRPAARACNDAISELIREFAPGAGTPRGSLSSPAPPPIP